MLRVRSRSTPKLFSPNSLVNRTQGFPAADRVFEPDQRLFFIFRTELHLHNYDVYSVILIIA